LALPVNEVRRHLRVGQAWLQRNWIAWVTVRVREGTEQAEICD